MSSNPECETYVLSPCSSGAVVQHGKDLVRLVPSTFGAFVFLEKHGPPSLFPGPLNFRIKVTYFKELNPSSEAVHINEGVALIGNGRGGPAPC